MPKLVWQTKLMAELQPNMTTEVSPPRFCMLSGVGYRTPVEARANMEAIAMRAAA